MEVANYVKTVVMLFDIHDSNLPLLIDFPVMIGNMLKYSVAPIIESNDYIAGSTVTTSPLPNCTSIMVTSENAETVSVSLINKTFLVKIPGVYTVTEYINKADTSSSQTAQLFVHIPSSESDIYVSGGSLGLGTTTQADEKELNTGFWGNLITNITNRFSSAVSIWPYLAMILIIILTVEWWVYYDEEL